MSNQILMPRAADVMSHFIKQTRSLCPVCMNEIEATMHTDGSRILLSKLCQEHGMTSDTIDPDATLYLQCTSNNQSAYKPYGTVIPISFRCDLHCSWCYLPNRGQEFSLEKIRGLIDSCGSRYIVFSGGEPTLRKELGALIEYVKRAHPEKQTVLLTNAVRLADPGIVAMLQKVGLHYCIVSLNGFRPETHLSLNGRDLSAEKKAALENLKREKVRTILSMTIARGINENEFKDVYLYALNNLDFIRQIRLRNVSNIGTFQEKGHIYLTDMVKMVSAATGFSISELCRENNTVNRRYKTGNYFMVNVFNLLKRRSKNTQLAEGAFVDDVGLRALRQAALEIIGRPGKALDERKTLSIEIFSWPTIENIDLEECRRFFVQHVTNTGEIFPFWEALFKNERTRIAATRHT